jgi:hypothetical protein
MTKDYIDREARNKVMDYISREELYEKTAEWEAQALHMVEKTMNDEDETDWKIWSAILKERSAFKFDVADMPSADVKPIVRCKECRHGYDDVGGKRCTYGVCVDCIVESDFYCAYGERDKDNG